MSKNINSNLRIRKKERHRLDYYLHGITSCDINIISQIITLVESHQAEDYELAQSILEECLLSKNEAKKIGISGIPGVGKSTFIEKFGQSLLEKGEKIAILAVDPSSDKSGGSILGDKTRMQKLSESQKAFIRPSPSKGVLGGVAQKTNEAIIVCEAAGFNTIIIETVGVGQSETIISHMVDFFLLLSLANTGDDLQGIKRGILEQANAIIFTKDDALNIEATQKAKNELKHSMHYLSQNIPNWEIPILTCSSLENKGFDEIDTMINLFFQISKESDYFERKRRSQKVYWFKSSIEYFLSSFYMNNQELKSTYDEMINALNNNQITATRAAKKFIEKVLSQK